MASICLACQSLHSHSHYGGWHRIHNQDDVMMPPADRICKNLCHLPQGNQQHRYNRRVRVLQLNVSGLSAAERSVTALLKNIM